MRSNLRKRLDEIEARETDFVGKLNIVDYDWILDDYEDGNWEEVHVSGSITVLRNKKTGEIRGIFADRRTDEEIISAGGTLAYL